MGGVDYFKVTEGLHISESKRTASVLIVILENGSCMFMIQIQTMK